MISTQCECGRSLKVEGRFAGRLVRCPQCSRTIRIPAGEPAGAAGSRPSAGALDTLSQASRASGVATAPAAPTAPVGAGATRTRLSKSRDTAVPAIVAGCGLLATLLLPWMVTPRVLDLPRQVVMSWDLIRDAPASVNLLIIGAWIIGLAAVVVGFAVRALPRAITHGALGFAGLLIVLVVLLTFMDEVLAEDLFYRSPWYGGRVGWLGILTTLLLMGTAVTLSVRLQTGPSIANRVAQGICGGGAVIPVLISLILEVSGFQDLPPLMRAGGVLAFGIIVHCLFLGATILALLGATLAKPVSGGLAAVAALLLYAAALAMVSFLLVVPAYMAESGGVVLLMLNVVLIIGGFTVMFCSGLARTIGGAVLAARGGAAGRTPSQAVGSSTVPGVGAEPAGAHRRLEALATLHQQGLISEQEYVAGRQRVLSEI